MNERAKFENPPSGFNYIEEPLYVAYCALWEEENVNDAESLRTRAEEFFTMLTMTDLFDQIDSLDEASLSKGNRDVLAITAPELREQAAKLKEPMKILLSQVNPTPGQTEQEIKIERTKQAVKIKIILFEIYNEAKTFRCHFREGEALYDILGEVLKRIFTLREIFRNSQMTLPDVF